MSIYVDLDYRDTFEAIVKAYGKDWNIIIAELYKVYRRRDKTSYKNPRDTLRRL